MKNPPATTKFIGLPKCALCGESLTAPYIYNGLFYGWTCIKKVNPTFKKNKTPELWIEAVSFETESFNNECGNGVKITALLNRYYNGDTTTKKFVEYNYERNTISGKTIIESNNGIAINDNKAFVNVYQYKCDIISYVKDKNQYLNENNGQYKLPKIITL